MAKHCDICNRSYPDELAACPHCAEAATSRQADEAKPLDQSRLQIELAENPPGPRVPPGSESDINISAVDKPKSTPSTHSESAIDLGARGKPTHHVPLPPGSESEIILRGASPQRVPDTNSGVAINAPDSPSSPSGVQWASLVEDVTPPSDLSAVHVDSPSDLDLLGQGAAAPDSGSLIEVSVPPASGISGDLSGSGSDVQVAPADDSGQRIIDKSVADVEVVRGEGMSEPDVTVVGDSGSGIEIKPPSPEGSADSSEINLGELRRKSYPLPSDLNLASDVLESGTSGVNLEAAPPSGSDSGVEAVVDQAQDIGPSSVRLGEESGSLGSQEPSGLDLTMLSGAESGSGSSILPQRPHRPGSVAGRPGEERKRPGAEGGVPGEDDSAVNLGVSEAPTDEIAEPQAQGDSEWETAPGVRLSDEVPSIDDAPTRVADRPPIPVEQEKESAPASRPLSARLPQSWPQVLAGSAVGLLLGVLATMGIVALRDRPKEVSSAKTAPASSIPVDDSIQDLIAKVHGKEPADIARALDQLGEEKKQREEAAKKVEDLEAQAKLAEKNAADLAEQLKIAQRKGADSSGRGTDDKALAELRRKLTDAQSESAKMATATKQAAENERKAQKMVEEERTAAKEAKSQATEALSNLETIKKEMERSKTLADKEIERLKSLAKDAGSKQPELMKQIAELTAAKKDADAALQAIVKRLKDAKYLPADAPAKEAAKALDQALVAARTTDPAGKLADAQSEAARYRQLLAQRWTPDVMLDIWLTALRQYPAGKDVAHLALADVARVNGDKQASNELRAKAACVQGLALRQQTKLDEARAALTLALRDAPAKGEWQAIAREALQDMNTPDALRPTSTDVRAQSEPNPFQAELHFSAGVNSYWAGAYARAAEQFQSAIRNDNQDARYHYYLGLARWSLGARDAARNAFDRGAELERQNRPAREAINALFERMQGSLRQEVDQFRK
jgi:hypothetical protein